MNSVTRKVGDILEKIESGELSINEAKYMDDPILCAAMEYDLIPMAEKLITLGANVNVQCSGFLDMETPLMIACDKENLPFVKKLVNKGANVNQKDSEGETAFHIACEKGNVEMVKYLFSKGAEVDAIKNNGYTPLMTAIVNKQTIIAKMLLKEDVNIEQETTRGYTVMDLAIMELQIPIIERLISKGVDIHRVDAIGNTYLHHIIIYTKNNFLYMHDLNKVIQIIQLFVDKGLDYTLENYYGKTALYLAEYYELYEIADMLQGLIGENEEENEEDENEPQANSAAIPRIPAEYNRPVPLRFMAIPPNTECFSPMNASDVDITNNKIVFYILDKDKKLVGVSCIDNDSYEFLDNINYIYYQCSESVPHGAVFVNRAQVLPEPLRRLTLDRNIYVYESQIKKVKPGHKYALIPTDLPIGRIVSETLLQTQYAVSTEHCQTHHPDVIYTIFEIVTSPTVPTVLSYKSLSGRNRSKSFRKSRQKQRRQRKTRKH